MTMNEEILKLKRQFWEKGKVDHVAKCGAELAMGDDFGDNKCTFRCGLSEGHKGRHQETGNLYAKYPYSLQWEGDMLDADDYHMIMTEDWQAFEQFCERENISYVIQKDELFDEEVGTLICMKKRYIRQFELELEKLWMEGTDNGSG